MKATGIVRRIDDLGRVVIPKEIRRTMRIREGDPLEIYTDNEGGVIFKKYSPIGELSQFATQYAEVLHKTTDLPVIICDKDHVVAVAGLSKKEVLERRVSPQMETLMEQRKSYIADTVGAEKFKVAEGLDRGAGAVSVIISSGDVVGSVSMLNRETGAIMTEAEQKLVEVAAMFLGKQMEE